MTGIAFEGREEPIVLLMTTNIPIITILTFLICEMSVIKVKRLFKKQRHTVDQLYGFSGSPSFQEMTFLSTGAMLDEDESGGENLLSASSRLYLSVASASSISETIRDNAL